MQVLPPRNSASPANWLKLLQSEKVDPCFLITGAIFLQDLYLTEMEEVCVLGSLQKTLGYLT